MNLKGEQAESFDMLIESPKLLRGLYNEIRGYEGFKGGRRRTRKMSSLKKIRNIVIHEPVKPKLADFKIMRINEKSDEHSEHTPK